MHNEDHISNSLSIVQQIVTNHVPSPEINESLQLPCKLLCDKEKDKEHSDHLTTMDSEEKQLVPLLFEENHFQHTSKASVWNEVCFPVTNLLEDLMLHVYHDPLVSVLQ